MEKRYLEKKEEALAAIKVCSYGINAESKDSILG